MLSLTNRLAAGVGVRQNNIQFHSKNGTRILVQYYRATASVKLTPHDVSSFLFFVFLYFFIYRLSSDLPVFSMLSTGQSDIVWKGIHDRLHRFSDQELWFKPGGVKQSTRGSKKWSLMPVHKWYILHIYFKKIPI